MAEALASRHIGRIIHAYRHHPWHPRPLSQDLLARWAHISQAGVSRLEKSRAAPQDLDVLTLWARTLHIPPDHLWWHIKGRDAGSCSIDAATRHTTRYLTDLQQVEFLRQGLTDALSEGTIAAASLDDWERTAERYGRATRDRPAPMLLDDLSADLTELKRTLHRHRSASALRRLTRVAAHMSGLMCLTFCKLDDRPAFRRWARTARLAADEAGDLETQSWILAQEAYGHFYSGDLSEAIDRARQAQCLMRSTPCVGAALAAALEARAQAAMGQRQETRTALAHAEGVLSQLHGDALTPSAFGYNEAQLRFHESNAYTRLGDVEAALNAQDRALVLCMPGDYTDWAMTRLDRATCLTATGDTTDGLAYAIDTVTRLTEQQRQGIITLRGYDMLHSLSKEQQSLPTARDLRDLLMLTTERREATDS